MGTVDHIFEQDDPTVAMLTSALQECHKLSTASRYASVLIHEVHNPLEAITNLVYLTKSDAHDAAKVSEYMTVVEDQLATLRDITTKVLSFHRAQSSMRDFDLIEIMESALKLHAGRLTSGEVALIRKFSVPATASVFGNEILQVVSNLLLNALDAMPKSGAELRVRIRTIGEHVHITVADNGSGMSTETLKGLFKPYRTTKPTGTGIGLWLSRKIVDKHGGKLKARSSQKDGRMGTTFRLSVPIKSAA